MTNPVPNTHKDEKRAFTHGSGGAAAAGAAACSAKGESIASQRGRTPASSELTSFQRVQCSSSGMASISSSLRSISEERSVTRYAGSSSRPLSSTFQSVSTCEPSWIVGAITTSRLQVRKSTEVAFCGERNWVRCSFRKLIRL